MPTATVTTEEAMRKLALCGDADACLYWLSMQANVKPALSPERCAAAEKTLASLGLLERVPLRRDERPTYSQETVLDHIEHDARFSALLGEVQRTLGRILSIEETKCLLSICDYLRLPDDVISVLVMYCVHRNRQRNLGMPSIRTIEKEAYAWADAGIDTFEAAADFMQQMLRRNSREGQICRVLQITGRNLTASEQKYVDQWIEWGFPDETIALAYDKTCTNTGGLKWPYLNSILARWHEKGLLTVRDVRAGDGAAQLRVTPAKGKYQPMSAAVISKIERDARKKLLSEGSENQ